MKYLIIDEGFERCVIDHKQLEILKQTDTLGLSVIELTDNQIIN